MKQKLTSIAAILVALTVFTNSALAASPSVGPQASDYLASYMAWMTAMGDGEVALSFDVMATDKMAEVGAGYLCIQEKEPGGTWKLVLTYYLGDNPDLLESDTYIYGTTVYYQGVAGYQYKGSIIAYAHGYDGGSDSRSVGTSTITAT